MWEQGIEARDAASVLREVHLLQRRTGSVARSFWFPISLFGALCVAAAPVCLLGDAAMGVYWTFVGPGGTLLTSAYFRRRESSLGVAVERRPYVVTACGIVLAAAAIGVLGHGTFQLVGPLLAVALGYLVFARLDRSVVLAVIGVTLGLVVGAVILADVRVPCSLLLSVLGASMIAVGITCRSRERR